jgi:hypothetical protein
MIGFHGCHEYGSESTIDFDAPSANPPAAGQPQAGQREPSGHE